MILRSTGEKNDDKWLLKPGEHLWNKQENTTARKKEIKQKKPRDSWRTHIIQLALGASLSSMKCKSTLKCVGSDTTRHGGGASSEKKKHLLTWHKYGSSCILKKDIHWKVSKFQQMLHKSRVWALILSCTQLNTDRTTGLFSTSQRKSRLFNVHLASKSRTCFSHL